MNTPSPSLDEDVPARTESASDVTQLRRIFAVTVVCVATIAINLLQACSFSGASQEELLRTPADVYRIINEAPFTLPSASDRWTVMEEVGRLKVEHGWSCASVPRALVDEDHIGTGILETAELEDGYAGTVLLNGWKLEYAGSDHNVVGLGSTIFNVYQVGNTLLWNAGGVLSDKNGDDAFDWCYAYTLVSWPKDSDRIDIEAIHSEPSGKLMFVDAEQGSTQGVVHSIPGTFRSKGKRPRLRKPPRARLLAGFGMVWTDNDHNVLQVGFDLGPATIAGRRIDWSSNVILKDNAAAHPYRSAEIVTILKGSSVRLWHPATVLRENANGVSTAQSNELSLTPRGTSTCPNVGAGGGHLYHFAVTNVPYRFAIPMLTGWDIGDFCNDNNVKSIGAWIEDFDYVPPANGQQGRLSYTVRTSFADNDSYPGIRDQLKIDVLGLDLVRGTGGLPPITPPTTPIQP